MKRRNSGLTIPELLAVLVIIGILAVVGIVTVNRTQAKQRETYNVTQNTLFVETAKLYFEEHKDLLPKTLYESEYVTLDELLADKYFDDYIKDYDKNSFSGNSKVKVTKVGENKYEYSAVLLDQGGQVVVETPDNPATITFTYKSMSATSGKYYVNKTPYIDVTMHDDDILKGYTFVIYKDEKVYKSSGVIEIESAKSFTETLMLDTSSYKDGEYKIKITVYDALGRKKSKTSEVIVIDKTAPKCSLNITGTAGLKGWYKTDVSLKLSVTEKNKVGIKQGISDSTTVSYNEKTTITQSDTKGKKWYGYVKDIAGNTGKCEKTVKVDTKKPVCSFSNPSTDIVITGEQATINLTCTDTTSLMDYDSIKLTLSNLENSATSAKLVSMTDPVIENNNVKYAIMFEGISYGSFKISLKANSVSDNVGYKNDKVTSSTITSYNKAEIPTNSLCVSRTYNGNPQQLTSTTLGTGYKLSGYTQTNANENGYTITATLEDGYRWSDKSNTTKTFKCPLHKATPVITLSATSGTVVAGNRITYNEKANVKGKFSVSSNNTSKATVTQASSNEVAANTNNLVTVQGVVGATTGSATITSNFVPTDTSNYNNADPKTYTVTVKKAYATNTVNGTTTYYEKLQEAINASTTGTVKLLDNTTENITINNGTSKTIDLNGKTVTGNVTNNGTVTISNGTIAGSVTSSGTITLNNVVVTGNVTNNGGTTSISGGSIGGNVTSNGTTTISNTPISGSVTNNGGTTNITGGSIGNGITNNGGTTTTTNTNITGNVTNNGGTTTIDGGKVTGSVTNNSGTTNLKNGEVTGDVTNKGNMTIKDEKIGGNLTNDGTISGQNVTVGGEYTNNNPGGGSGNGGSGGSQDNDISGLSAPNDKRTKITIPTNSICVARTYTGSSQRLTSKISDTGYVLSGYDQINAGEYTITAALTDSTTYKWANNAVVAQTFKCSMSKATPILELPSTTGEVYVGKSTYITANIKSNTSVDAAGVVHLASSNTTYATVQNDETQTATPTGISNPFTVYGKSSNGTSASTATITVSFTPTDTVNYNKPADKTFTITVKPLVWSATFNPNGAELTASTGCTKDSSTGVVTCSCTTSGTSTSCNLTAPKITRTDYTVLGFNTSSDDKTPRLSSEGTLNMPNSTNFYAITKYDVIVTFHANGNTLTLDDKTATGTGSLTNTCTLYNNDTSCEMKTPTITGTTNTPNIPSWGAFQATNRYSYESGISHNTTVTAYKLGITYYRSGSKSKEFYAFSASNTSTYTANWNENGASLSSTAQSSCTTDVTWNGATPTTSCTLDAPTITRDDYTIIGFNTTASATSNNSSYDTSTKKLTLTSSNTGSTWYALTSYRQVMVFNANYSTITLNGNTATGTNFLTNACTMYNTDTTCTMTVPTITKTGYTIKGFYDRETWSYSDKEAGSVVGSNTTLTVQKGGYLYYQTNLTNYLYANTFKEITISWNANNATVNTTSSTCAMKNGASSCSITAPSFTRKGYDSIGWNTSSGATSSTWNIGTLKDVSADATYYAITTPSKIKLTLDQNGGSGGTTAMWYYYNTNTFYSNEACTTVITSITTPTRKGYTFEGYYGDGTHGGDSDEIYIRSDGTWYGDLNSDIYENATLTAHWSANKIKLTLNQSSGSGGTTEMWFYYGTNKFYSSSSMISEITSITTPTRTGFSFSRYYGDGTHGGYDSETYIKADGTWYDDLCSDIYENATLYAEWVDVQPPSKPSISVSGTSSGQMTVSFGATDNVGISYYVVYWGTSTSSMSSTTVSTSATSSSKTITGLSNGQDYYLKVEAYDAAGYNSTSDVVTKKINILRVYQTSAITNYSYVSTGENSVSIGQHLESTGGAVLYGQFPVYSQDRDIYQNVGGTWVKFISNLNCGEPTGLVGLAGYWYTSYTRVGNWSYGGKGYKLSNPASLWVTAWCRKYNADNAVIYGIDGVTVNAASITLKASTGNSKIAGAIGGYSISSGGLAYQNSYQNVSTGTVTYYKTVITYNVTTLYRADPLYSYYNVTHTNYSEAGRGYNATYYSVY